ncbi:MAG: phosphatidate cytidylyltransferase [Holosporaceae bacterium]|jgi:phosphatidate cytidylyltransferase|nr:phosphatidate cytidylyltransferase [Holosporaceae bacterium]
MADSMEVSEKQMIAVRKDRKELLTRLLSSFLFIPMILLMCLVPYWLFCGLTAIVYVAIVFEIFSKKIHGHLAIRIAAGAVCFCGILAFMYCRRTLGVLGCVFLIFTSSFTDIGSYCFGKAFGGPKLCPKISPNKTWAGLCGGIILANIACYCLEELFLPMYGGELPSLNMYNFVMVQYIILSSVVGDLLESLFKRKINVKDTGAIFPGHGGFLDRLDSLIFSSITLALSVVFF